MSLRVASLGTDPYRTTCPALASRGAGSRIARMSVSLRPMTLEDCPQVLALWRQSEGIGLNDSDSAPAIANFFARNPDLSPVALSPGGEVVGAVLCGHDGRRGYLHHLAVAEEHRNQGIASELIDWCFDRLFALGIQKCNVFLFKDNAAGARFWQHVGWNARDDLRVFQRVVE